MPEWNHREATGAGWTKCAGSHHSCARSFPAESACCNARQHEVQVQCALPVLFRQSGVASIRSIRTSNAVDEDVDATPLVQETVGKLRDTLHAAKIRLHKERGLLSLRQRRTSSRSNRGPCHTKAAHDGLSGAFGSTRHEDTLVFELVGNKEMRVVHHGSPPHSCTGKSFSPYCDNGKYARKSMLGRLDDEALHTHFCRCRC